jgi:hypothetical protein
MSHLIINTIDDPKFRCGNKTAAYYVAVGTLIPQAAVE